MNIWSIITIGLVSFGVYVHRIFCWNLKVDTVQIFEL